MMTQKLQWLYAIPILLLAFVFYISGIDFGQPAPEYATSTYSVDKLHTQTPVHPDEYFLVTIPVQMSLTETFNPHWFEYPTGLMYLNMAFYQVTGRMADLSLEARQGDSLRTYAPFDFYISARLLSVYGGIIAVAVGFAVARKLDGQFAAVGAALLISVAYTMVQYTHYSKPAMPATGVMMLVVYLSMIALHTKNITTRDRAYLLAGVLTGLAMTFRYNGLSIGIVMGVSGLILLYRYRNLRMGIVFIGALLCVPVVFIAGTPYFLLDFDAFMRDFTYITGQFQSGGASINAYYLTDSTLKGLFFILRYLFLSIIGLPATLFIMAGIVVTIRSRSDNRLLDRQNITVAFVLILLLFVLLYGFVVLRTVRPLWTGNHTTLLVPCLSILAAIGMADLHRRIPGYSLIKTPVFILILLIVPLVSSVQLLAQFNQQDTRQVMQHWIYETIPRDAQMILVGAYNVPLDTADFSYSQEFHPPSIENRNLDNFDYLVYSDALYFSVTRSDELVPADVRATWQHHLDMLNQRYSRIATLERPRWTGTTDWMNAGAYWHNPSIYIYCLHRDACDALRGTP